jgi:hypothetical protein
MTSSVTRAVSGAAGRLRAQPQEQPDGYAFCAKDSFWFRPAYTDGRCPLCGEVAPGGAPPPPLLARLDRAVLGMGVLMLASVGMSVLVLVMYFQS